MLATRTSGQNQSNMKNQHHSLQTQPVQETSFYFLRRKDSQNPSSQSTKTKYVPQNNNSKNFVASSPIFILPHHIYPIIQEFSSSKDYHSFLSTHNSYDQRELRRETIIFYLTEDYSQRFTSDLNFHEKLSKKINSPIRQLFLSFIYNPTIHRNIRQLEDVFKIANVPSPSSSSSPRQQHQQGEDRNCVVEENELVNKKYFFPTRVYGMRLSHFHRLTHLKGLQEVKILHLSHLTQLVDLSPLKGLSLEEIILYNCSEVVDISPLFQIATVILRFCKKVSNLSSLGNHKKLSLEGCVNITSVNGLKNIDSLAFINCINLKKFSKLQNIQSLLLQDCTSIVDISSLKSIPHIAIHHCAFLRDLNPILYQLSDSSVNTTIPKSQQQQSTETITPLKSLEVVSCPSVDISKPSGDSEISEQDDIYSSNKSSKLLARQQQQQQYPSLQKLKVVSPYDSIDFSLFSKVQKIELHSLTIHDVSVFANIPHVIIHLCYGIIDVSPLKNCNTLVLSHCPRIDNVSMLGNIPNLVLNNCRKIVDISSLGQVQQVSVKIERCQQIKSFISLKSVKYVQIIDCIGLTVWNEMNGVESLTVDSCNQLEEISNGLNLKILQIYRCKRLMTTSGHFPVLERCVIRGCDQLTPYIKDIRKLLFST